MLIRSALAMGLGSTFLTLAAANAQVVEPNHLDCRPAANAGELVCPSAEAVTTGRASVSGDVTAERGSEAWRNACAAKFRSFNPATGTYRAFSGEERPCT
jgi:hypothetical protein